MTFTLHRSWLRCTSYRSRSTLTLDITRTQILLYRWLVTPKMDKELFTQFIIYISIILSICIVIVNVLCIGVIIASTKLRQKPPTVFILNLLVTHLLQGVFVLPVYALKKAKTYPKDLYPLVCDAWRLSYMLTFYGTCINVLLVAVDRFIATRFAVSTTIRLTTARCRVICGVAWLYMVMLCLIPFLPLQR